MKLKKYQKKVINDLNRFLTLLTERQSIKEAYRVFWEEKDIAVGFGGVPYYQSVIPGVPHICLKVPTGGGKTFLAANAIKPIFESMPNEHPKAVVWLVPSDAILTQTQKALMDNEHPYRQKINTDFGNSVEVYSKKQLLNGHNFNPASVNEQLSIFILSYDSFRTNKKEGRKAYQENGYLASFAKLKSDASILLEDTDETALIQVIRRLNPLVIVDESHHATTKLSVEMLKNFNPSFVLDLTATPKSGSNIISYVEAKQLKIEQMIKLPVIVYNRKSQDDVFLGAISLRSKLEAEAERERQEAEREEQGSGRYIRPIVLFQAQPKNNSDSTTYEKIKNILIDIGIPDEQIAIKTGDKDEIKDLDLMSTDCPIRYIITVNALKEGWDCPFAYILATVANRTSSVDVEQILGRVLRLPYTKSTKKDVLNLSYVITSSSDFSGTLDNVVVGLNNAGFSSKDYRVGEMSDETAEAADEIVPKQLEFDGVLEKEEEEDVPHIDTETLKDQMDNILRESSGQYDVSNKVVDSMLATALTQNNVYWEEMEVEEEVEVSDIPMEVREKMNKFYMNERFVQETMDLFLPQFVVKTEPSLFSEDEYVLLEKENLQVGFTLKDKDVQIDFSTVDLEMAKVDVDDSPDSTPKAWTLQGFDSIYIKEWFDSQPSEKKLRHCKEMICKKLSSINAVNDKELYDYVDRIIDNMTEDQLTDLEQSPYPYIMKIQNKVKHLLESHASKVFDKWLEQELIICQPHYHFPPYISPVKFTSTVPNSLYTSEEDMNDYERKVVMKLASMNNIKWWHRNISRKGFMINGSVHAYPDIIVMTNGGKVLLIETKGDYLDNDESKEKARLGAKWDSFAGRMFRYFMVFQSKQPDYSGAYSYDRFIEIIEKL